MSANALGDAIAAASGPQPRNSDAGDEARLPECHLSRIQLGASKSRRKGRGRGDLSIWRHVGGAVGWVS